MSSLYAQYLRERTHDGIIEDEHGFATYRLLLPDIIYLVDLFVVPEMRLQAHASFLAEQVCQIGRDNSCTDLMGTVNLNCKGASSGIKTLLAYGMHPESATDNFIVFKKRIS